LTAGIASVSLGQEREFVLHHKEKKTTKKITLSNGSLLWMGGDCQKVYKHSVPKRVKADGERINITFRNVKQK
jgi:alkylated DNA repair dioxygenase AlkB